ncbi:MFS transporter [Cohnella kolymensis]|uniref:MFS transporter n=1 Tax=Cohnella kolymensis TaxID=1590652 RepID=UPI0013791613|nr:MFS transporter [Cohnella kolymensis]
MNLNYRLVLMINMIMLMVISGVKPIVVLHATDIGVTSTQISLFIASYAFFPAVLGIQIGKWIDRYGMHRMVIGAHSVLAAALALGAVYPSFLTFIIQQTMMGISVTFLMVALQKRVGSFEGNLDKLVANFTLSSAIGSMMGPLLTALIYDRFGFFFANSVNIILVLIGLASCFLIRKSGWDSVVESEEVTHPDSIWLMLGNRDLRNAIIISGLVLSSRELFSSFFPLLAVQMNVGPTLIGALMAFYGLTAIVIRLAQFRLVGRLGRIKILMYSLYLSGIVFWFLPYSPSTAILLILVGLLGAGLGLGLPLSLSYSLQASPVERQGEVLGLRLTVNRASQFALPLVLGAFSGLLGISIIFWSCGTMLALFGYVIRPKPEVRSHENNHTSADH